MNSKKTPQYQRIPTFLTPEQFERFVLPHLPTDTKPGPDLKLTWYKLINYFLKFLYLGCQWKELPIDKNAEGKPEIHYSNIHRALSSLTEGVIEKIFEASVRALHEAEKLDTSIIHGDGTSTPAKKGGDTIGYNGHKHFKGDKVVTFCDRNGNIIAPFVSAAGNRNESPLLRQAIPKLVGMARAIGFKLDGVFLSLDGVYDCRENRKAIFNNGMIPNIPENPRNRKKPKPGPKPFFDPDIFEERFCTIERSFAWEDKFKRLLLRFERRSELHYALKLLAYTMINLRNFCTS